MDQPNATGPDAGFDAELRRLIPIHAAVRLLFAAAAVGIVLFLAPEEYSRTVSLPASAFFMLFAALSPLLVRRLPVRGLATAGVIIDLIYGTTMLAAYVGPVTSVGWLLMYGVVAVGAAPYFRLAGALVTFVAGAVIYFAVATPLGWVVPSGQELGLILAFCLAVAAGVAADLIYDQRKRSLAPARERDALATLIEATRGLTLATNEDEVATAALDAIDRVLPSPAALFGIYDPTAGGVRRLAARLPVGTPDFDLHWPADQGIIGHVIGTGRTYYAPDTRKDPFFVDGVGAFRSEVTAPLIVGGTVVGVVDLNREAVNAFSAAELRLLAVLADQVAVTLEAVRSLQGRLRNRAISLRMERFNTEVQEAPTEAAAQLAATSAARDVLDARIAVYWQRRPDSDDLLHAVAVAVRQGEPPDMPPSRDRLLLDALRQRSRQLVADLDGGAMLADVSRSSLLAVPVEARNEEMGLIALSREGIYSIAPDDAETITVLARTTSQRILNIRLLERTVIQAGRIEASAQLARLLTSSLTLEEIFDRLADALARQIEFDRLVLAIAESGALRTFILRDPDPALVGTTGFRPLVDTRAARALADNLAYFRDDISHAPESDVEHMLARRGFRATLSAPMTVNQRTVGAISLSSLRAGTYIQESIDIIVPLAEQIGIAVLNGLLYRQVEEQAERLDRLNRLTAIARSSLDLDESLPAFIAELRKIAPVSQASLVVRAGAGWWLIATDDPELAFKRRRVVYRPQNISEHVIRSGQPLVFSTNALPADPPPGAQDWLDRTGLRAVLALPLATADRQVGSLMLGSTDPAAFPPAVVTAIEPAIIQLSAAVEQAVLLYETQAAARRLEAINRAAGVLNEHLDLADGFDEFIDVLRAVWRIDRSSLGVVQDRDIVRYAVAGPADPSVPLGGVMVQSDVAALHRGEVVVLSDHSQAGAEHREWVLGLRSSITFPLVREGSLIGVWGLASTNEDTYSSETADQLQPLAEQLTAAVINSRLYQQTVEAADRSTAINRVAELLNSSVSLADIFDELVGHVHGVLPFRRLRVIAARRTAHGWEYNGAFSEQGVKQTADRGPIGNPVIVRALDTLQPFIRDDMGSAAPGGHEPGMAAAGVRSSLVLPLVSKSIAVGVLIVSGDHPAAFSPASAEVLEPIAALIGAELDRANRFAELAAFAVTDPLTGVSNRRRFNSMLELELQSAAGASGSLAVLLIDIDHFKTVNDSLGHLVGDQLLVSLAGVLQASLRTSDLLARFGGDEFIVLLPGAGASGAEAVARKMQQAVRQMHFTARRREFPISLSLGGAVFPDNGTMATALIAAADRALYAAKAAGRDRLVINAD